MPIRIWLCTKWMAENSGGADNNLFGKMSTTDIGKTARRTDFQKLGSSLETPEGQRQHPEGVAAQVASAERLSDIDARVEKSGESLMAELMFGDAGNTALQDKADTPGVAVRGDSLLGVQTESLPIALTEQRLATVSNLTFIVPQLPLTLHAFKATKKSSYETARTHISPPTSSFNSPLSPFRSPPPGRDEGEEGGVSEEPDEMVLSCDEPVLTSPSMEVENELRLPVSGMDGLCFSGEYMYSMHPHYTTSTLTNHVILFRP